MFIIYRGLIDSIKYTEREKKIKYNTIGFDGNSTVKKLILTDLYASPLIFKKDPLKTLLKGIKKEKPNVILGDFNTPYSSKLFEHYKKELNDFHHLGKGWTSTWPYFLPVFELDIIWLDKKHTPISMTRKNTMLSDHKLLVATFN